MASNRVFKLLDYVGISLFSVAVSTGFGKHTSALSDDDLIRTLKIAWIAQVPQVLVLTVAKISIVVFLLKLFPRHKGLRWFLYITMSMNTIITIIPLIFIFTQCNPTAGSWNPFIQAHCWSPTTQRDFAVLSAGKPSLECIRLGLLLSSASFQRFYRSSFCSISGFDCLET